MFIIPLPGRYKLIYKHIDGYMHDEYVKKFSDEELANIDMEALDYINIVEWFADIWEAVSQQASEADPDQSATPESEQQPPAQPPIRFGGAASHNRFMGIGQFYACASSGRKWHHAAPYLPGTKLADLWGHGYNHRH
jgi:hypothetical protein